MSCSNCGVVVAEGARFCSACGTPVVHSLNEERKVVTILFADVVGFTSLAEGRDPEAVKRLIDGCLSRLVADVIEFGGTVDKILGDGILAMFGAPVAHEDDAERAVRSALRMQESVEAYASLTATELRLRIGVNTGEVLVGSLKAGGDYTAMGDVVNTAARLQTESPIGRVLVAESTFALTQQSIRFESFGDVSVRGRDESVTGWLAIEPLVRPGVRRHRHDLDFVGRDPELSVMLSSMKYAIGRNRALLIAIDGEGGVGKSRLVEEVIGGVRQLGAITVLEGECVPYGESNVFWPVASAISRYVGVDLSTSPEELPKQLALRAGELLGQPPHAPDVTRVVDGFKHLVGLPSPLDDLEPVSAHAALSRAIIGLLGARLSMGPLVVAITDVHWADPVVLELFEEILANLTGFPFLLVTTARTDADVVWPPSNGSFAMLRVRLEPLDAIAAAQLSAQILGPSADAGTVARLFERTGGNPLFLEELASLVVDKGSATELPDSLRALVAARLDQLTPEQRTMLDNAAVLGSSGNWVSLERFGREIGQPATTSTVQALVDLGLLEFDGRRWSFRSESVRDVAYQTLTKTARAQRHCGVAAAMEELVKKPAADVGHHWATAAELVKELGSIPGVPADVIARAVNSLTEAAEDALGDAHQHAVIRLTTRALELVSGVDSGIPVATRLKLRLLRAAADLELRQVDKARVELDAVIAASESSTDFVALATAHRLYGEYYRNTGDLNRSRASLDLALELCRRSGDDRLLARTLRARGFLEVFGGVAVDAAPYLDEADVLYTKLGDRGGLAWVQQHRAWAAFVNGDLQRADELLHRAAEVMDELGDRTGLGWVFGLLAYVRFMQGDRTAAAVVARQVTEGADERSDDWALAMMHVLHANLSLWAGHTLEAVDLAEKARQRMRRLGDPFGQAMAYAPLARSYAALGQATNAQRAIEEMASSSNTMQAGFVDVIEAEVALHLGDPERVVRCAEKAEAFEGDNEIGNYELLVAKGLALLQLGRVDEAMVELDRAELLGSTPFGLSVNSIAAALLGDASLALDIAARVDGAVAATYLDRVYAAIARVAALRARGETSAAIEALKAAVDAVSTTDDTVARATIAVVGQEFGAGFDDAAVAIDLPLRGWRQLGRSLAAVSIVTTAAPVAGR